MLKEQFLEVLKSFGERYFEDLELDEDTNTTSLIIDDNVLINITYLDNSDTVLIYTALAPFSSAEPMAYEMAKSLMQLNDIGQMGANVTFMYDETNNLLLIGDRCSALLLSTEDDFAAWIEVLLEAFYKTRDYFLEHYPKEEEIK